MSDFRRIRLRRAPSGEWISVNPILGLGEPGYEIETKFIKVGDGITSWSGLSYVDIPPVKINFPEIYLSIADGADPRVAINLSSGQYLNVVGSGDTTISYNNTARSLIIESRSGSGFLTAPNIINRLGYIPQISGNYSVVGHTHSIDQVSGLQLSLDNKQPTGLYAISGHVHNLAIGDGSSSAINYSTNERLNIVGSGYTNIYYDNGSNTITINSLGNSGVTSFNSRSGVINLSFTDISGALNYIPQPVGNYAISGHRHYLSDIIDFSRSTTNIPYRMIASSSSSGNPGDIVWDSSYLYICVANNLWRRSAHSSW
jgi:hypothetical protein